MLGFASELSCTVAQIVQVQKHVVAGIAVETGADEMLDLAHEFDGSLARACDHLAYAGVGKY
jgi:hypothetical protein